MLVLVSLLLYWVFAPLHTVPPTGVSGGITTGNLGLPSPGPATKATSTWETTVTTPQEGVLPGEEPTGSLIEIRAVGGQSITVNNFYKQSVEIDSYGDVLLKDTPDYQLVYFSKDNAFLITIVGLQIGSARNAAETGFLNTLGITRGRACLLNVSLKVPFNVNPNASGEDYGLSFCPNGKPFPK